MTKKQIIRALKGLFLALTLSFSHSGYGLTMDTQIMVDEATGQRVANPRVAGKVVIEKETSTIFKTKMLVADSTTPALLQQEIHVDISRLLFPDFKPGWHEFYIEPAVTQANRWKRIPEVK